MAQLVARYVRDVEVAGSSLVTPTDAERKVVRKLSSSLFIIANFLIFFSHTVKYFYYLCSRKINKKGVLHCGLRLYPRT